MEDWEKIIEAEEAAEYEKTKRSGLNYMTPRSVAQYAWRMADDADYEVKKLKIVQLILSIAVFALAFAVFLKTH